MKHRQLKNANRRGMSTVELAIVAPLLLILLFGIIEFGWYFMVRNIVHHAAAEVCTLATRPGYEDEDDNGANYDDLKAAAQALIDELGYTLNDADFDRDPATSNQDPCEVITISIPMEDVVLPGFVLDTFFDLAADHVEFTVTNAHPSYAGNAPGIICAASGGG